MIYDDKHTVRFWVDDVNRVIACWFSAESGVFVREGYEPMAGLFADALEKER